MKIKQLLFCSFFFLLPQGATAEYAISASEIKMMPPFCKGLSLSNFQANAKHLRRSVRVPGQHTQHFCHGMKALVRGQRAEMRKKGSGKGLYGTAVQEFEYVQSHSTKKHTLIPATSLYKATALEKLGRRGEAIREYNKAISLKKKYPHAYSKLSDYYLKLGLKQDALETIKRGLKQSPKSKSLKRRLKKLQGKQKTK
jgi:tetratricopeptide (TPR) repeat protein